MERKAIRLLEEALGKEGELDKESSSDFWAGKTPCWQMCHCPKMIRDECPAYLNQNVPCWSLARTYCKLPSGTDLAICYFCRVHKKYGANEVLTIVSE